MRILYFHQYFTTPSGSGGIRSYELARHALAHGHHVTMVCGAIVGAGLDLPEIRPGLRHGMVDGIAVYQFNLPYSNRMGLLQRTLVFMKFSMHGIRLALQQDYDLLFATSTPLTAGIPGIAMKLCGRSKPFVFEVRDLWPELPKAMGAIRNPVLLGAMSLLEWLSYRAADACIGLAPGIVEGIRKRSRAGLPVACVPNGCDLDLFTPGDRAQLSLPGLSKQDFVAVYTGTHGPANGLDAVLDAAAVLQSRGFPQIKLVLIGDGKNKEALRKRAQDEGLANVCFVDPIPKRTLCALLGNVDCGMQVLANVEAFYFGTSPNKFFDYLAAGRPILINYPGWLAGLIEQHNAGIAVPADNPAAFADALIHLATHSDACAEMGRNARRLAETEFSRTTLANRWLDVVEQAAHTAHPSPP